jgi:hypothetical protein
MAERKSRYSKLTPKQRAIKHRAVEVAAFVLGLRIEEQKIKEGKGSYKKLLPDDANWWERYANERALRRGSIMRQAAKKFGESEKQIYRYIKRVVREGWIDEVQAEFASDRLNDWFDACLDVKRRAARSGITFVSRAVRGRSTTAAVRRTRKQGAVRAP